MVFQVLFGRQLQQLQTIQLGRDLALNVRLTELALERYPPISSSNSPVLTWKWLFVRNLRRSFLQQPSIVRPRSCSCNFVSGCRIVQWCCLTRLPAAIFSQLSGSPDSSCCSPQEATTAQESEL